MHLLTGKTSIGRPSTPVSQRHEPPRRIACTLTFGRYEYWYTVAVTHIVSAKLGKAPASQNVRLSKNNGVQTAPYPLPGFTSFRPRRAMFEGNVRLHGICEIGKRLISVPDLSHVCS